MDQFVQELRNVGQTESVGEFTVNPQKAREKLREYQLLRPGSYVLKVVQAAVSAGALDIGVRATRDELTLSFGTLDSVLPSAGDLLKNLTEGLEQPSKRSSLHHLTAAVNGAYAQDVREIRWETPDGALQVTGSDFIELKGASKTFSFVVRKRRTLGQWFRGTVYVDEIRQLESRGFYGPQTITIDNRQLGRPKWDRYLEPYRDDLGLDREAYLLECWAPDGSQAYLRPPDYNCYSGAGSQGGITTINPAFKPESRVPLLYQGPIGTDVEGVDLAVAIRPSFHQPSALLVVCDGVLLDKVEKADLGHPGALVLTGMEGLNTDLSEFGVVRDQSFEDRLQRIQTFVQSCTESVTKEQLEQVLGSQVDSLTQSRLFDWFQSHQLPEATSVEDLVWRHFPRTLLDLKPNIPVDQQEGALKTYESCLSEGETILALYDDGLIGKAEVGFVITDQKLAWKNTMEGAQYKLWQEFPRDEEDAEAKDREFVLERVPTILKPELNIHLASFLTDIRLLHFGAPPEFEAEEWKLHQLILSHLGKTEGVYYYPYIPKDKLEGALKNFPELRTASDRVLALYDDTMFGSADNGFLITEQGLYWRNILSSSISVKWADLDPNSVKLDGTELVVDGEPLSMYREALREPTLAFFRAMSGRTKP